MNIKTVSIKNFRAIRQQSFDIKDLSILIGNNGTAKTTILEAINFCLSPYFLSGKIKHTDFYNGTDEPIILEITFDTTFTVFLPDGYIEQQENCIGIYVEIKKREQASSRKSFSDIVVITHYAIPSRPKDNTKGWEIKRKGHTPSKKSIFKFDERLLSLSRLKTDGLLRSFYFGKNRENQLKQGFNSSATNIFDDFNWRFMKGVKKIKVEKETVNEQKDFWSSAKDDFFTRKNDLEKEILNTVDEASVKKSFTSLNKKLKEFGIQEIELSFLHSSTPFDTAFISHKLKNLELPASKLGSGIEMIISLLFLETLASISKENIIILIDEPELHLHPSLQSQFIEYLINLCESNQIILSTHSPYFFKNCTNNPAIELLITENSKEDIRIKNTNIKPKLLPWSPSWGEINYFAYQLPTVEFHNELYGYLQEKTKRFGIAKFEKYLINQGFEKTKEWTRVDLTPNKIEDSTLSTYIRNWIHHPETTGINKKYTSLELQQSIDELIKLTSKLNLISRILKILHYE